MMERDLLILVDGDDRVTGAMSKREAHTFGDDTPRGWLHRAFSCFLFDARGRMLLTKRADSKITFPGVWTNACCSHPLHGRVPDEVDTAPVASDAFAMPGIKHAAPRQPEPEPGIDKRSERWLWRKMGSFAEGGGAGIVTARHLVSVGWPRLPQYMPRRPPSS